MFMATYISYTVVYALQEHGARGTSIAYALNTNGGLAPDAPPTSIEFAVFFCIHVIDLNLFWRDTICPTFYGATGQSVL